MTTVFIKPIDGALVRHPDTMTPLPKEGATVELTTYWRRRLLDGSVAVVEAVPAVPAAPETATTHDESESARSDKRRRA